jgi:CspA family cold shock protein
MALAGGSDVFVHVHEVEFAGMKTLVKGQLLTYNTAPARDGRLKAVDLRLLSR